jgi:hypothetical protein
MPPEEYYESDSCSKSKRSRDDDEFLYDEDTEDC